MQGQELTPLFGRRNLALNRQVRQKRLYLGRAHVAGMAKAAEFNKPPYPVDISLLGTYAVVQPPNLMAELIQQLGGSGNWVCLHFRFRAY